MSYAVNKLRPSKLKLQSQLWMTQLQLAAHYKCDKSTISRWLKTYGLEAKPDRPEVQIGQWPKRPKHDITNMNAEGRPTCKNCGRVMAKCGISRKGLQIWRCGKDFQTCSRLVQGEAEKQPKSGRPVRSKLPDNETLIEHLKAAWTFDMIGKHYGCSRQTVANRVWERGLTGYSAYRQKKSRERQEPEAEKTDPIVFRARDKWSSLEGINGFRFSWGMSCD